MSSSGPRIGQVVCTDSGGVVAEIWGSPDLATIMEYPGKVPKGQRFDKSVKGRWRGSAVVQSRQVGRVDEFEVPCSACGVMTLDVVAIGDRLKKGKLPALIKVGRPIP